MGRCLCLVLEGMGAILGPLVGNTAWRESLGRSVVSRMLEKMGYSDKEAI